MTRAQRTIINALCYADVFDYPMTRFELWRALDRKVSHSEFNRALEQLTVNNQIISKDYFALKKRHALFYLRKKRERLAQKKHLLARKAVIPLRLIPSVWFVGISGSLAVNNTEKNADIDLFVVTAPHTLWTTRLLVISSLRLLANTRKVGQREAKDALCINMWMDGVELPLPKNERDLYTAHELIQLRPLINKHHTYERLLFANKWVREFLPNSRIFPKPSGSLHVRTAPALYENLNRRLQLWYMARHRSSETIGKNLLKFHPHDVRQNVLKKYKRKTRSFFTR